MYAPSITLPQPTIPTRTGPLLNRALDALVTDVFPEGMRDELNVVPLPFLD